MGAVAVRRLGHRGLGHYASQRSTRDLLAGRVRPDEVPTVEAVTEVGDDDEKVRACQAAKKAGADFVKTSTGFSKGGATVADIALMRRTVGSELGVKASGGVKGLEDARKMVEAGATRIGASVGVKIAQEAAGKTPTTVKSSAY
mgnify:CR=1 FL=1